jgi:hypothetical protein
MSIKRFTGERILPFFLTSDAQLERNRFVTFNKSTLKAAYTSYGSVAEGVTRIRHEEYNASYDATVMPLSYADTTFFVTMASAVDVGDLIFPTKDGKGVTATYEVQSMSRVAVPTPVEGESWIVSGSAWDDSAGFEPAAGSLVTYDGEDWVEVTLAEAEGTVIFNVEDGKYYICSTTVWVPTKKAAISGGKGSAGSDVVCYNVSSPAVISREDLPVELNHSSRILISGIADVGAADTSVEVASGVISAGDTVIATIQAATNAIYVTRAVSAAGKITITVSGVGGAGTKVGYIVMRAIV